MRRPTAKHEPELRESCGRLGDTSEQVRGVKDTKRRPTDSTNLGPWGLTEARPPTRERAGVNLDPLHFCKAWVAWSSCGTPDKWSRGYLSLCFLPFHQPGLFGWASVKEDVPSRLELDVQK